MIIYPAIDIRGGKCVRLIEGRFDQETVFDDDPAAVARRWQSQGAQFLHVVDLDGAVAGKPVNLPTIKAIVAAVAVPVQVGGGIRSLDTIEELFAAGVTRVILGSAAVNNPELVAEACRLYGDKIVVGIDARNGIAAVEGWGKSGGIAAVELASAMARIGVGRVIFTDISRDGKLSGVNVTATVELATAANVKVIASGGVRSLDDIYLLRQASGSIEGVIVGKALYTGALSLPDALRVLAAKEADHAD